MMDIVATQIFAHHSVNFIPFQQSFKNYAFNESVVSGKAYNTITLLVYLVG